MKEWLSSWSWGWFSSWSLSSWRASARPCRRLRSQPETRASRQRRTMPASSNFRLHARSPISSSAPADTPDLDLRNALTARRNSGPPGQLGAYQRGDLLCHVRMSGVVGMHTVRADQVGPTDEPALADRVDE